MFSAYYLKYRVRENARNICVATVSAKALLSQTTGLFDLCGVLPL